MDHSLSCILNLACVCGKPAQVSYLFKEESLETSCIAELTSLWGLAGTTNRQDTKGVREQVIIFFASCGPTGLSSDYRTHTAAAILGSHGKRGTLNR